MAPSHPNRYLLAALAFAAGIIFSSVASRPASAWAQEIVRLAGGSTIALATPQLVQVGKRYQITFPGGGPAMTHTLKEIRPDGWVLVEVADENIDPAFLITGQLPTRWLNIALATSIQEMRSLPY